MFPFQEALADCVLTTPVVCSRTGQRHHRITDIIGRKHGIGVENLSGSAAIAGETARAYRECVTLSYVTGRTVGIGAYVVRLGQRVIQKRNAPIILTGFQALNKVLGKSVYASNDQLGGPNIMARNGITHQVVEDDLEGVAAMLHWLSFSPAARNAPLALPALPDVSAVGAAAAPAPARSLTSLPASVDSPLRTIAVVPGKARDVRDMLSGVYDPVSKAWQPGFFDQHSFTEYQATWAQTVVVARARLGGVPMGVLAVESRSVEAVTPADPAAPDSKEAVHAQAGQVWYPDSATKTAQAIRDMAGESLPLIIFANWRGFSGGTRDMYDAVLKFGANIVEALTEYPCPVFVYLPPFSELRGGAWVVVDSAIHAAGIEMYADPQSRGGILEAEGLVDVKFRRGDLLAAARRWDPTLQSLDGDVAAGKATVAGAPTSVEKVIKRENLLFPVFHQVACEFADLHDTAGRMAAKGVISSVQPWATARTFFYWRVQRRLLTAHLTQRLVAAQVVRQASDGPAALQRWLVAELGGDAAAAAALWADSAALVPWLTAHVDALDQWISAQRVAAFAEQLAAMRRQDPAALAAALAAAQVQ